MVLLWTARAQGSAPFDPALRFRTLETPHFIVYFHQGEERLAAELAVIVEETWRELSGPADTAPPRGRTHVVLVDQTDAANGSAFPLPYNTIIVTAAWPAGADFIGHTSDWLRLVFTHEYAHIVHLDRSEGWAGVVRRLFGRVPVAFPNLLLPLWQIEGLATFEESIVTGEGRLDARDFRAIEREAARGGALEPIDRVNGGLTAWPNGLAPYAYGLGFHAYLAERYGGDALAALATRTARSLPYAGSRAFEHVFGRPLGALWRDYQDSLAASAGPPAAVGDATRLTHHGFMVSGPRFAPPACRACPEEIVYSVRTPDGFPSLNAVTLDGRPARRLATRYLGSTSGVSRDVVVFDQQELRRNVGLYGDLYLLERATGRVRALTSSARLQDPDLSPDGRSIVCVREGRGQRDLVLVRLSPGSSDPGGADPVPAEATQAGARPTGADFSRSVAAVTTLVAETDTQFNSPRWSPDGRFIAVERHRRGRLSEIVVVDPETLETRTVASRQGARFVTPAWRPDGAAILAAADLNDDVFNVYELALAGAAAGTARQLTFTTGGATWPDVSPAGKTLVFAGYTVDGFDLFTIPYPSTPAELPTVMAAPAGAAPDPLVRAPLDEIGLTLAYSPWPTLIPRAWTPVVESRTDQLRLGAATGGGDVLGYHAYVAAASWLVDRPGDAPAVAETPDWDVAYAYNRWQPSFFVSASSTTSFLAEPSADAGVPSRGSVRERQVEAGVLFPIRRVRRTQRVVASLLRSADDYRLPDGRTARHRTAVRAGWAMASALTYGFSISPERGVAIGATAEVVARALGSSAHATAFTADARAYVPGFGAHHVLALRAAAGVSSGDAEARRAFQLGGASPNPSVLDFGRDAISLLRGFASGRFAGSRAAVVNLDYRWPIARPQRGVGTWPLLLHTVHASVFADAGHAWTQRFRAQEVKTAAGAELSLNLVAGYALPLTVTVGAGWGRDGAARTDGGAAYVRVGRAF